MGKRSVALLAAVGLCCLLVPVATGALAQGTPTADWWVLASGGGPSTVAGEVTVDDTWGQPIIGPADAGSVSLGAGYWYGAAGQGYQAYLPLVLRDSP